MKSIKTKLAQRRAPNDVEYDNELKWFQDFQKLVKDLEARVKTFNNATKTLFLEGEKLAVQSAKGGLYSCLCEATVATNAN
jgi:hypothetical protein